MIYIFTWKFINNYEVLNNYTENAKSAAYNIIRNFPDVKKGLFLWGNPGTGKTLLSSIILSELIIRYAIEGRYIKISRTFYNRIKSTFNESSPNYGEANEIERGFAEVDILVIDDFGIQRDSEWELETLYNLVDARYEALTMKLLPSRVSSRAEHFLSVVTFFASSSSPGFLSTSHRCFPTISPPSDIFMKLSLQRTIFPSPSSSRRPS